MVSLVPIRASRNGLDLHHKSIGNSVTLQDLKTQDLSARSSSGTYDANLENQNRMIAARLNRPPPCQLRS